MSILSVLDLHLSTCAKLDETGTLINVTKLICTTILVVQLADDGPAGSVCALHVDDLELPEVGEVNAKVRNTFVPLLTVGGGDEERRASVHREVGAYHHHG